MLNGLFIVSIILVCAGAIKDACTPKIPAENWENMDLYYKDIRDGVPLEQRLKNARNGRYKKVK